MPVWGALLGTLGLNYIQHKRGKPTICAVTRRALRTHTPSGRAAFVMSWAVLTGVLVPHILRNKHKEH